jgi:uncharacterized metal-binding protein
MLSTNFLVILMGIVLGSILGRISAMVAAALDFERKKREKRGVRV